MMMRGAHFSGLLGIIGSLAACSGETTPEHAASSTPSRPAAELVSVGPEMPALVPAAPAPGPSASGKTIPAALQGRWGMVPADCTSTRGDAKGLLTIGPDTLRFYESRARLGAVKQRDDSRILATFAFSGEGMEWSREVVLDAQDSGQVLIRREAGADAAPGAFRYTRCK